MCRRRPSFAIVGHRRRSFFFFRLSVYPSFRLCFCPSPRSRGRFPRFSFLVSNSFSNRRAAQATDAISASSSPKRRYATLNRSVQQEGSGEVICGGGRETDRLPTLPVSLLIEGNERQRYLTSSASKAIGAPRRLLTKPFRFAKNLSPVSVCKCKSTRYLASDNQPAIMMRMLC